MLLNGVKSENSSEKKSNWPYEDYGPVNNNAQEQQNIQRKVQEVEKDLKGSAFCLDMCCLLTLFD